MTVMRTMTLAVAALLLAACASTRLQKPDLEVVNVDLLGGNLLQQQLRVRLKVINPNDRTLSVRGVTYEVELAGDEFAHGSTASQFVVPALGQTEFDVDVTTNMAGALLKLFGRGSKLDNVDYRVTGRVQLASGMVRSIPFSHEGLLNLK